MKRRRAKVRKVNAKMGSPKPMEKMFAAALNGAIAKSRREEEAEHQKEMRQLWEATKVAQRKLPKRSLSQLRFTEQHWWGKGQIFKRYKKAGKIQRNIAVNHAKAALIYEAMRRRKEVQDAWLKGQFGLRANGWQEFVGMVIRHLPSCWQQLDDMTKDTFVDWMQSPWFVPPLGYSTFPEKSTPKECERAALQKLPSIGEMDSPSGEHNFIQYLKRFEDAGFIFMAIDHKSSQRGAYALNALRKLLRWLPHTVRKQDLRLTVEHHLPPDISAQDRQELEEKARKGALTQGDVDEVWRKHSKPTSDLSTPWQKTATYHEQIAGKRQRKSKHGETPVDELRFDLPRLFAELADLDKGKIQGSDFVARLRLS